MEVKDTNVNVIGERPTWYREPIHWLRFHWKTKIYNRFFRDPIAKIHVKLFNLTDWTKTPHHTNWERNVKLNNIKNSFIFLLLIGFAVGLAFLINKYLPSFLSTWLIIPILIWIWVILRFWRSYLQ